MIPRFLQPERLRFTSVEIIPPSADALIARKTDSQPLVIICAWCPTVDRLNPSNATVSHGICPNCAARLLQEGA